jgi:DNA-binding MarR family transcriptional regulator
LQSEVWRKLGVTPSVVCRMMRSLEHLGLIKRRVPEPGGDRRQREVVLTEKGHRCFREAYRMVVRWVQRYVYEVICFGKHRDPEERCWNMAALESYLNGLRKYSHDTAKLYYEWGYPDH